MSKFIAMAIVSALTLFANSVNLNPPPSLPQDDKMEVMVLFSGLMVFNEYPAGSYEVGILGPDLSKVHEFCVQRLGATRVCRETKQAKTAKAGRMANARHKESAQTSLPDGIKWTLFVDGTQPNETPVATTQHPRRPDVEGSQFDFDWIIDLDGKQFHDTKLVLNGNQLQPIIKLPKVRLFTKYKSPDFFRRQGTQKELFGFVAETIGFRIQLKKGEELILKQDDPEQIVARVPYVAPTATGGNYEVLTISNTRYPQHDDSDFQTYYKLFSNRELQDPSKWYDFSENKTEPCKPPNEPPHEKDPCEAHNPAPKKNSKRKPEKDTCCGLVCTAIRLVNLDGPLK